MPSRPDKTPLPTDPIIPAPGGGGDPRKAPFGEPIAFPDPDQRYPQDGLPYPNPDAFRVLSLNPPSAVIGDPDFTIHVLGQGFDVDCQIIWNGSPEPTTFVSATELTAGVNMATVVGPATIPISVRNKDGMDTNALDFEFQDVTP